ncbi:MAG: carboxypeptidase-like regulatory domain-containing protein [Chitinophagaceae bacterium]|nr:MAG: carboxypeptidase-like regulatory domain-containing protein [Chitinophagaceae bacterium]
MRLVNALILFLILFSFHDLVAQQTISGKIIDQETGEAIVGANVYINNTTIGNASTKNGQYIINNVPDGKQELVISFIGYEISSYSFSSSQLPLKIDFKLKRKIHQLNEVVIGGGYRIVTNDPHHWNNFIRGFIGITPFSAKCSIKNKEDIELRFYEKSGVLKAVTSKPIVVINEALDYSIEFDLENYESKLSTRNFLGKAYFKELNSKKNTKSKIKLREAAYYGSITHFLRSVYTNTAEKEGFEMRSILRNVNAEKHRYQALLNDKNLDKSKVKDFIMNRNNDLFGDSSVRIRNMLFKPDYLPDLISNQFTRAEDIKAINEAGDVILSTKDSLFSVVYTKPLASEIRSFIGSEHQADGNVKSVLKLKANKEIVINPKINSVSRGVGFEGFFSRLYSISTLLPEDYEPVPK